MIEKKKESSLSHQIVGDMRWLDLAVAVFICVPTKPSKK